MEENVRECKSKRLIQGGFIVKFKTENLYLVKIPISSINLSGRCTKYKGALFFKIYLAVITIARIR